MYKRVICRYDMDIHRNLCAKIKSFYCSFLVISAMGTSRGGKNPFFKRKIGATETGHAEKYMVCLTPVGRSVRRPFKARLYVRLEAIQVRAGGTGGGGAVGSGGGRLPDELGAAVA